MGVDVLAPKFVSVYLPELSDSRSEKLLRSSSLIRDRKLRAGPSRGASKALRPSASVPCLPPAASLTSAAAGKGGAGARQPLGASSAPLPAQLPIWVAPPPPSSKRVVLPTVPRQPRVAAGGCSPSPAAPPSAAHRGRSAVVSLPPTAQHQPPTEESDCEDLRALLLAQRQRCAALEAAVNSALELAAPLDQPFSVQHPRVSACDCRQPVFDRTSDTTTSWYRSPVHKVALGKISSAASNVAGCLDQVIERCANLGTPASNEDVIFRMLYEASYGDPVYMNARRAMEVRAVEGATAEGTEDGATTKELLGVVRHIRETLEELQGSSWAVDALQSLSSVTVAGDAVTDAIAVKTQSPKSARRVTVCVLPARSASTSPARTRCSSVSSSGPSRVPSTLPSPSAACRAGVAADPFDASEAQASEGASADCVKIESHSRNRSATFGDVGPDGELMLDEHRLKLAFRRFRMPDSAEVHKDDLPDLLQYMGHVTTSACREIAGQVTSYEHLDFEEFVSFMEKFVPHEQEEFHRIFDEFDEDNSGNIDMTEMKTVLTALGFIPAKKMMEQALAVAGLGDMTDLGFDDFITFLKAYQHSEGFTEEEVEDMRNSFDHFAMEGSSVLDPDHISDALVAVFGLHIHDQAEAIEACLKAGGFQKAVHARRGGGDGKAQPVIVGFDEFLIMGRWVRQESLRKLEEAHPQWVSGRKGAAKRQAGRFEEADFDDSGGISEEELWLALRKAGFTPLREVIDEILAEVVTGAWSRERELDFYEYFAFLLMMQRREGFSKAAVMEFKRVFEKFDGDGSGEVSALELAHIFGHLGYNASLNELHVFVKEVDANESGRLDFREFLRLMNLHRESELAKYRAVFDDHRMIGDFVPSSELADCLEELGFEPPKVVQLLHNRADRLHALGLDFDAFVTAVDTSRVEFHARQRKFANFSEKRVEQFQRMFNYFDRDRSGGIDFKELLQLLKHFGWEPGSIEEQQDIMVKLATARERAREAGCSDTSGPDGRLLSFHCFLQLARICEMGAEEAEQERLAGLSEKLRFSVEEVDQFRAIFCERKKGSLQAGGSSALTAEEPAGLDKEALRKVMRSLVVSISREDKALLDRKLQEMSLTQDAVLDFPGFLTFMRWLLDTDFAGLNARLAQRHAAEISKKRAETL